MLSACETWSRKEKSVTTVRAIPELLTIAAFLELPEDDDGPRYELVEGRLVMAPRPTYRHNRFAFQLSRMIHDQRPESLHVIQDVDVDLNLVAPEDPATVRCPDIAIVQEGADRRLRTSSGILHATDLVLAIEIVSPGSVRTDRVFKLADYADAGIPHYWIVGLEPVVSVRRFRLVPGRGYEDLGEAVDILEVTEPFPFSIDLRQLT